MKLFQKISAGILIAFGLLVTSLAIIEIASPQTPQKDKEGYFRVMLWYGVAPAGIGITLVRHILEAEKESDRIQSIFYLLLKKHGGELTPMLFAMETELSSGDAKQYLDQKAKEFKAKCEVDDQGNATYRFNVGKS